MTLTSFLNDPKLGKGAQNKLGEGENFYSRTRSRHVNKSSIIVIKNFVTGVWIFAGFDFDDDAVEETSQRRKRRKSVNGWTAE